jgi:small multidrug resistance family-3 protein
MGTTLLESLRFWMILALSALLEVGGDAGMRAGLQGKRTGFVLGALLLASYGLVVNLPKWDFGRLLGVYIAVFFLVSQGIAVVAFHERLSTPRLVGGALIVAGGLVLTFYSKSG